MQGELQNGVASLHFQHESDYILHPLAGRNPFP
jgi:hypothetical protein